MNRTLCLPLLVVYAVLGMGLSGWADELSLAEPEPVGKSFLNREWYEAQGIELPRRFGVGVNAIYMRRDIAVTDVLVQVGNLPTQSVRDFFDFEVQNETLLTMARVDMWALPFLNVYAMFGETRTDTSLSTTFTYDPPSGPPQQISVEENQEVDGPLYGGGATVVFGGEVLFVMADANYSESDLDLFDGSIGAWFVSSRMGWHHTTSFGQVQAWGGIGYMNSKRALTMTTNVPVLGPTTVIVEQEPVDPFTYQFGSRLSLNNRWDFMAEVGSNFDDAHMLVLSGCLRF